MIAHFSFGPVVCTLPLPNPNSLQKTKQALQFRAIFHYRAGRATLTLVLHWLLGAQEVLLLKRDVLTREIQEQWHADRPAIDGGTLGDSPVWPGTWVIDVVCRVSDGSEHNIWLKALDRTIAASPEASFINQFTL